MSERQLSRRSQISAVGTTGTSAALNGDIIDMASGGGFESVAFIGYQSASATVAASTTGPRLVVQVGTASGSLSDATGQVVGNKTALYYDLDRPKYRFVRGIFRSGSATCAYRSLVTIAYGARSQPTTQPASTTGGVFYSQGTGTATG